jgi:hypothetical protein
MKYKSVNSKGAICGHNHRTISGAFRCLLAFGDGGFYDLNIIRLDDKNLSASEDKELTRLWARKYNQARGW